MNSSDNRYVVAVQLQLLSAVKACFLSKRNPSLTIERAVINRWVCPIATRGLLFS
jgi:hypothetical protein